MMIVHKSDPSRALAGRNGARTHPQGNCHITRKHANCNQNLDNEVVIRRLIFSFAAGDRVGRSRKIVAKDIHAVGVDLADDLSHRSPECDRQDGVAEESSLRSRSSPFSVRSVDR
jgi:hypothetical protein